MADAEKTRIPRCVGGGRPRLQIERWMLPGKVLLYHKAGRVLLNGRLIGSQERGLLRVGCITV